MRHDRRLAVLRAFAVLLLSCVLALPQGCSFSASSRGSSNSSESSSDSSASSSGSSSPESAEAQYKSDVREYTAAYVKTGGQFDAFRRGLGDIAKKHNITNWEDNTVTYEGIGEARRFAERQARRARSGRRGLPVRAALAGHLRDIDVLVAHQGVRRGKLQHSVEHQAAATRGATVEGNTNSSRWLGRCPSSTES